MYWLLSQRIIQAVTNKFLIPSCWYKYNPYSIVYLCKFFFGSFYSFLSICTSCLLSFGWIRICDCGWLTQKKKLLKSKNVYMYVYVYIYMCVCVCVIECICDHWTDRSECSDLLCTLRVSCLPQNLYAQKFPNNIQHWMRWTSLSGKMWISPFGNQASKT